MLIKCSADGQVLWMSPTARAALGEARTLADTVVSASERPLEPPFGQARGICFSLVSGAPDGLLLSAHLLSQVDGVHEEVEPRDLKGEDLRRFSRLERTARRWVSHARRRQPGGSSRAVIGLIEEERARVGRELHTGVGQLLVSILRQAEAADGRLPADDAAGKQSLERISTAASEALALVRSVSARLHPPEWQRLSLEAALEQLWRISSIAERYEAELDLAPAPSETDPIIKALIYRAAQEAFSNIDQHAHASRVRMSLAVGPQQLELTVWDNGPGIDTAALVAAPASIGTGIGLRSIREQADAVGGKMVLESGPLGTKLVVSAPFAAPD